MAEKYLKGFLVFHNKRPPKVHQLEALINLCARIDPDFKNLKGEGILLSEYYIETRYPNGFFEIFSWDDADKAFKAAKKIKKFILEKIK